MAGIDSSSIYISEAYANFRLQSKEEPLDVLLLEEVSIEPEEVHPWMLVDRFNTEGSVNFESMRQTLASIWQPLARVTIDKALNNRFTFRFYSEFDFKRMVERAPWTFKGAVLCF